MDMRPAPRWEKGMRGAKQREYQLRIGHKQRKHLRRKHLYVEILHLRLPWADSFQMPGRQDAIKC